MAELTFDGRVAVVTGAGRGIGAGYARLLAERGARVVVNDVGASMAGAGADEGPAADVVARILAAGGEALADTGDVSTEAGATGLVARAVETFGRIDIVVNNAGIIDWAGFPTVDQDNLDRHLAVHLHGTFHTCRAAWPHLVDQGHGSIVNTTSSGVFGLRDNTGYAAAKAAVIGLTRNLAVAGRRHGIRANCVAPAGWTRMAGATEEGDDPSPMAAAMAPDLVAPLVGYLAHESCGASGEIYTAGAGRFARILLASTPGWVSDGPATVEDVAAHWGEIDDESGAVVPADLNEWSASFLAHLGESQS